MIVAAHGNVTEYCKAHDMIVCETYEGDLLDYNGASPIIVTDIVMDETEFYALKLRMLKRGVEVVSTHYNDLERSKLIAYLAENQRKKRTGGRVKFGYSRQNGELVENPETMPVVRRIFRLRDQGETLRKIQATEGIEYPDGRKLSVSTIQVILQNRNFYESGESNG